VGLSSVLMRRRAVSAFSPASRMPELRGWWQVDRSLTKTAGAFASLVDLTPLNHPGLPVTGKNLPAIIAQAPGVGNKGVLRFSRDGVGQPIQFAGVNMLPPLTVYIVMTMGAQAGVNQVFFDSAGSAPRLYTYPGGPPDTLVQIGGGQSLTGINLTSSSAALTAIFNVAGALSGAAKSSEVLDYQLDIGPAYGTAVGFTFGIDKAFTPAYALDGDLAEIVIVTGVDTQAQQRDFLSYFQGEYGLGVDFTPPGTRVRMKYAINLTSSPATYANTPLAPLVTPAGALRIYTRFSAQYAPVADVPGRNQILWAQYNAGAGPEAFETVDGQITAKSASVTVTSEMTIPYTAGQDVETFVAVGGGAVPEMAYRCDGPGGAWLPVPLPGAAVQAAITVTTGVVNLGGDPSGTAVAGVWRELVAFTDGAQPVGYKKPTYAAGVVAIVGDVCGQPSLAGGWPLLAYRDIMKAVPIPRLVGMSTDGYEDIHARRVAGIDPLLVAGGQNILVIAGGGRYSIVGRTDTAAAAFSALQTLCTAARAAGWKVLVTTILPSTSLTDATRVALNTSITGAGFVGTYADAVADVAGNATIGAAGANTGTSYMTTNIGLLLRGGRIYGSIVAPVLAGLLA
jgi:hypothetical protein